MENNSSIEAEFGNSAFLADVLDLDAEIGTRTLRGFTELAWPIVDPGNPFLPGMHIDAVCDHLQAVTEGYIDRLLINMPPGHAKSLLVSVMWPAWSWVRNPHWQAIFSSYADDLATRDSVRCRTLIKTPWYQRTFVRGAWALKSDSDRKDDFHNTVTGRRLSTSVGGGNTGHRGNVIVSDDPQKAGDVYSETALNGVIRWWDGTMSSRLNNPMKGARVVVQQRLSENDLSAHLLASKRYQHLCLPSEYNPRRKCVTFTKDKCKFWEDPRTEEGELLFPALYPREAIEDAKTPGVGMGPAQFSGQHNQQPTPDDGGIFKTKHWRFWKPAGIRQEGDHKRPEGCMLPSESPARELPNNLIEIISVDCAFKDQKHNDWVAMVVIGYSGAERYVLERIRGHFNFQETCRQLVALANRWPNAYKKLVEDAANGPAVVNALTATMPGLVAVKPEGGKQSRAAAVMPSTEAGQVYLPEGAAWLEEWVHEFKAFPNGKHDDQVDAYSQALNHLNASPDLARLLALAEL